jgi:hypothetical protein
VELDNAIFSQKKKDFEYSAFPLDFSFKLASVPELPGDVPFHPCLFENPEFESFGSYFYDTMEDPWTPADLTYKLLSPEPDGGIEDLGDVAYDRDSAEPSNSRTPEFSYPSPTVDEQDITEVTSVEEDDVRDSFVPPSFTRPNKRTNDRLSAPRAKKRRVSVAPISVPSTSAVRFPCTIPGCKQVCKTLGDLKRHESILAHKPPSWECRRCHYQFTREDALKRHNKNVPNCANVKMPPKGRSASMKPQRPSEVELV